MQQDDTFKQLLVDSVWKFMQGDPLSDFLDDFQVQQALLYLSDIFTREGFVPCTLND
jgi:hypothetical protein